MVVETFADVAIFVEAEEAEEADRTTNGEGMIARDRLTTSTIAAEEEEEITEEAEEEVAAEEAGPSRTAHTMRPAPAIGSFPCKKNPDSNFRGCHISFLNILYLILGNFVGAIRPLRNRVAMPGAETTETSGSRLDRIGNQPNLKRADGTNQIQSRPSRPNRKKRKRARYPTGNSGTHLEDKVGMQAVLDN